MVPAWDVGWDAQLTPNSLPGWSSSGWLKKHQKIGSVTIPSQCRMVSDVSKSRWNISHNFFLLGGLEHLFPFSWEFHHPN